MEEILDVVNENNKLTGVKKARNIVHRDGYWHRTAHVWIINKNNEVLCNKRSSKKEVFPGKWEPVVGGHVKSGKTYRTTALEELSEELGIKSPQLRVIGNFKISFTDTKTLSKNSEFVQAYLLRTNKTVKELRLQAAEIEKTQYFAFSKIMNRQFIPTWDYYKEAINKIKLMINAKDL